MKITDWRKRLFSIINSATINKTGTLEYDGLLIMDSMSGTGIKRGDKTVRIESPEFKFAIEQRLRDLRDNAKRERDDKNADRIWEIMG